MTEPIIVVSVF